VSITGTAPWLAGRRRQASGQAPAW